MQLTFAISFYIKVYAISEYIIAAIINLLSFKFNNDKDSFLNII